MKRVFITATLFIIVQTAFAQNIIKSNDPHIHYMGRVKVNADSAELSWSGNSVTINFNGTGVSALLRDQSGINYFKVISMGK